MWEECDHCGGSGTLRHFIKARPECVLADPRHQYPSHFQAHVPCGAWPELIRVRQCHSCSTDTLSHPAYSRDEGRYVLVSTFDWTPKH